MESPEDLLSSIESLTIREGDAIIRESRANQILEDLAKQGVENAATAQFLQAFLACLPADGVNTFRQDIIELKTPARLRQHHAALMSGLLTPCKLMKQNLAVT